MTSHSRGPCVSHGAIYTADAGRHTAGAIAVSGDRIVFVGDSEAASAWIGADTVTDLPGKAGFPACTTPTSTGETIQIDKV